MKRILLLTNIVMMISFVSCRKPHPEQPIDAVLSVNVTNPYLDGTKLDSATISWEINGRLRSEKMILKNNKLSVPVKNFQPGDGKLSIKIYSNVKINGSFPILWVMERAFKMEDKSVILNGPNSYNDVDWLPRVILSDVVDHYAIIALRPTDPYFYVRNIHPDVIELVVAREYWKTKSGIQQVAGGEWRCKTGCMDENKNVMNNAFFSFLPQQIGTKQWNHIEGSVFYPTTSYGEGYVLSFTHDVE